MQTSGFSRNSWFLIPISRGETGICHPANARALIDYFILGSTNKAISSNEPKKHFSVIVSTS